MGKLYNIKGYWKKFDLPDFNDNDVWEGQILLEDDGWFEGIVIDRSNQELDRFIFGVYGPEKGIELYKLVPLQISYPFVFHGMHTSKGYMGTFELIHDLGTTALGSTLIKTEKPFCNDIDKAVDALKDRIQLFKDTTMHLSAEELYNNSVSQRYVLCTIHNGNFEGKRFSIQEMKKLSEESKASTDKIVESTANELGMSVEDTKRLMFEPGETPLSEVFEI